MRIKNKKVFSELSKEGSVISELGINPAHGESGLSGCDKDRFGVTCIISAMRAV